MNSFIVGFFAFVMCSGFALAQNPLELSFGWTPTQVQLKEGGPSKAVYLGFQNGAIWPKFSTIVCYPETDAHDTIEMKAGLLSPWKKLIDVTGIEINKPLKFKKLLFRAREDKMCQNKQYFVELACYDRESPVKENPLLIKYTTLEINVQNTEQGSMCSDPHLTQKVSGFSEDGESVTKDVCYDLYGKSGDQMELISDNVLGTSIVFELRDDYYIGKVFYATKLGYFNFTTDTISTSKSSSFKWKKEDSFVIGEKEKYPHAIISKNEMDVLIEYYDKDRSQSIRIAKIQQSSFGKSYLNIMIEKSTSFKGVFDEHHGGIFGLIANQDYEFYEPIQETIDLTVVKINGRYVKAFLTGKPGDTDRCYSMSLGDLMFPKNVYSFQKSL
ncbi:DgyrCDS9728 [Dimorphilus gyrociliatus]|uniref:DgyrCDS9728 n=1 Tax=Dimorphilus gyrociliatus TaxID=2664684 RepID=A0A7I8VZ82_9ANNE|nr:DgyrCDS9728 [Dimorphilus gyrociliatus]